MDRLIDKENENLKLPSDIPEGFFDIVSKVLNFIEEVDSTKNKND